MEGSRLFLYSADPAFAARWQREFRARMNARRTYDALPLTDVAVLPHALAADRLSHVDRLAVRMSWTLGSCSIVLDRLDLTTPEHVPLAARKQFLDDSLDLWADAQRASQRLADAWGDHGWGSATAKVVLVGDRYRGTKARPLPFSNPEGASATLSLLLEAAGLAERDLYVVNAFQRDGFPTIMGLENMPGTTRRIVALGTHATERVEVMLEKRGLSSYVAFPHPQYLGRFERAKVEEWGRKLRGLVEDVL